MHSKTIKTGISTTTHIIQIGAFIHPPDLVDKENDLTTPKRYMYIAIPPIKLNSRSIGNGIGMGYTAAQITLDKVRGSVAVEYTLVARKIFVQQGISFA